MRLDGERGAHALALDAAANFALGFSLDVNVAAGSDAGVGGLRDGEGGQESGREEGEFGNESHGWLQGLWPAVRGP